MKTKPTGLCDHLKNAHSKMLPKIDYDRIDIINCVHMYTPKQSFRSIYAGSCMHSCSWFIHWYSWWCVSLCHLCGVLLYGSVGGFCSWLHFKKVQLIIKIFILLSNQCNSGIQSLHKIEEGCNYQWLASSQQ